ncbi:MAG: hypothetical protein GF320_23145, partial [Armatimonadia bacterium]|nr:hypothetical protein [Armatimonadia bacterium]
MMMSMFGEPGLASLGLGSREPVAKAPAPRPAAFRKSRLSMGHSPRHTCSVPAARGLPGGAGEAGPGGAIYGEVMTVSIVLLMALLAGIQAPPTVQGPYVRFVVISDPHIPARGMEAADDVVQAILAMEPPPAFVIDTGDSTELGWRSEIDEYVRRIKEPLEAADIPLYAVPGNHDARWSEYDLQYFRERINPAPQLVRRHGLGLMLLNTGLPGEQHGQVEPFELEQLLEQRARTEPYAPLFAFAHHPILEGDPYVSRSIPLVNQLRAAGATALFVGHGHSFRHYRVNGLDQFMTGSVLDRTYRIVEVDWDKVVTWGENTEGEEIAG